MKDGSLLPTPFLDLSSTSVRAAPSRGSSAWPSIRRYATNGRFVVHYTDVSGNTTRLGVSSVRDDPDRADPASETVLLTVEQPFANHNGGQILFGPDGMLYIGLGDGGSGGDPGGRGQSLTDLLGDILRVDVSSGTGLHSPSRQSLRRPGRRPARGLELRPPQSLALQLRCRHRRPLHRRRRPERLGGGGRRGRRRRGRPRCQLRLERDRGSPLLRQPGLRSSQFTLPVLEYSHARGLLDQRRITSTGALPFPPCRGIISTPTTAGAGSGASGCRTVRRSSRSSGPPSRPAAPCRASDRTPRASCTS